MIEFLVSLLKRFWRWLTREPKDLDKAIKTSKHQALVYCLLGFFCFIGAAVSVFGFAPVLAAAKVSGVYTEIEYLSLANGVNCVMLLFSVLGLFFRTESLSSENNALYYRLRKLEKRLEAEAAT